MPVDASFWRDRPARHRDFSIDEPTRLGNTYWPDGYLRKAA